MSDHPRTDKVSTPHIGFYSCATVPSSFAYELEAEAESLKKEVDALKVKVANQADRIRYLEGATNHACGTPLSNAIKERDELITQCKALWDMVNREKKKTYDALRERDKAKDEQSKILFLLKSAQSALDAIHLEVGGWIKTMKDNMN